MPLTVRLPDVPSVPAPLRGESYTLRRLLSPGKTNSKLAKAEALGWVVAGLSLAPAMESGRQVCPDSTPGCRSICLYGQGRPRTFTRIQAARVARTVAWHEHREWFLSQLRAELAGLRGPRTAVRLNVFSDLPWERLCPGMFSEFPGIQFYDYTKSYRRMVSELPPNYHLTFSRSERNEAACGALLAANKNVSVVFRRAPLPTEWWGFPAVNGELHDLRFLDGSGVVVALLAKGGKGDTSGFVVDRVPLPVIQP